MICCPHYFSGLTPQRRQFTYPRVLDKTESHHALLKNFRSTYILDEALNTPILEDSFTGMSEVWYYLNYFYQPSANMGWMTSTYISTPHNVS